MLLLLDYFFVLFHSALIIFNLFGWIHPSTRKAHLICVLATGGSWFILGLFYGIGYCPLTDWHWRVLEQMGQTYLPESYVKYIISRLTGINLTASLADQLTLGGWLFALFTQIVITVRKKRKSGKL